MAEIVKSYKLKNQGQLLRFENWLYEQEYSPHTRRSYLRTLADFADFLRSDSLLDADHLAIRQYLAHLYGRGNNSQSVANRIAALKIFYGYAHSAGLIDTNPAGLIRHKRRPSKLPRILAPEQVARLIAAADNPRDRAILEFFYATGCRIAELCAVRIEDMNLDSRQVLLHGKGSKDRIVPVGRKAIAALKEYLKGRTWGYLFAGERTHSNGQPATPAGNLPLDIRTVRLLLYRISFRAGLGRVNPHALRHAAATHLLNGGANLRAIQEFLGHSSLSTTQIYLHLATADLARTIERCHPRAK